MAATFDSDTRKYLHELDSFGRPPELFKIHAEPRAPESWSRPPPQHKPDFRQKLHQINIDHQKRLSEDSNRSTSRTSSPKFAVTVAEGPKILKTEMLKSGEKAEIKKEDSDNLRQSVLRANRPLNPWVEAQRVSPEVSTSYARSLRSPLNVHTTSDQLSSGGNSISPQSPLSNSATSTSSNSSINSSKWRPTRAADGTFHAKMVNTEPKQDEKVIIRTYRPNSSASSSSSTTIKDKDPVQLRTGSVFVDSPSSRRIRDQVHPVNNNNNFKKESAPKSLRFLEEIESENKKRVDDLTDNFGRQRIASPALRVIGKCGKCNQSVYDNNEVTHALDSLFHDSCFTCHKCSQSLRGKQFYHVNDNNYCEDDYYKMRRKMTVCDSCENPISDMVLQAMGKSFHPECFKCHQCGTCLDGVPFAVDNDQRVFCMEDYETLFSPNCAACHRPIKPSNEYGQIVRIVAMEKEFHINCYCCEGCGVQLTNEKDKQCYPLKDHLLCRSCNLHWSKVANIPITDC